MELMKLLKKALRLYFRNMGVTVWEKSINTEDNNRDKLFQKLILRSNRLVLETVKERTFIKKYDQESVCADSLKLGGWSKVWDISKVMPH